MGARLFLITINLQVFSFNTSLYWISFLHADSWTIVQNLPNILKYIIWLDTLKKFFCNKIIIESLSENKGMQLRQFSLPCYYEYAIHMTQNHFSGEYSLLARNKY